MGERFGCLRHGAERCRIIFKNGVLLYFCMSEKDLKIINDLAKKELERLKTMTKEEAFQKLVDAGIFKKNGQYTAAYSNLAKAVKKL